MIDKSKYVLSTQKSANSCLPTRWPGNFAGCGWGGCLSTLPVAPFLLMLLTEVVGVQKTMIGKIRRDWSAVIDNFNLWKKIVKDWHMTDADADYVPISSNTRIYTLLSVPSSPGRSFLTWRGYNGQRWRQWEWWFWRWLPWRRLWRPKHFACIESHWLLSYCIPHCVGCLCKHCVASCNTKRN